MNDKYPYRKDSKFIETILNKPPLINDSDLNKSADATFSVWGCLMIFLGLVIMLVALIIYFSKFLETQVLNGW